MAINEQCYKCGRDYGSCPYYVQEEVNPCQYYLKPIDNSGFFSHFLSSKGRIGRIQYLVTVLIAVAIYIALCFIVGALVGPYAVQNNAILISLLCMIPSAALIILAGLKRCHDSSADWWYAIVPIVLLFVTGLIVVAIGVIAFIYLYCQKGDEGLNAFGSEPLKPYEEQIRWQQES